MDSLRQQLLAKRIDLAEDPDLQARLESLAIDFFNQLKADCVAIYWPIQGEPDLRSVALKWLKESPSKTLALPVVKADHPLIFAPWNQDLPLTKGPQGIPEPLIDSNSTPVQPDVVIVPCLGWSFQNNQFWRVGYGGGYYDRTLSNWKEKGHSFKAIGVGYRSLEVKEGDWRPQQHDQALDSVLLI